MIGKWIFVVALGLALPQVATAEILVTVGTVKQDPLRLRNLLDGDEREYLRSDDLDSSWSAASRDGDEYFITAYIAKDDFRSLRIDGIINANETDNWYVIEFESDFSIDGDAQTSRSYSPYGDFPTLNKHYLSESHVIPGGTHGYGFELRDRTCTFNTGPCLSEATYELTIRVKEILSNPLPGDTNLDGKVAFDDFLTLSKNYGDSQLENGWFGGDFGFDGTAGFSDFNYLSANLGKSKEVVFASPDPVNAIPEPSNGVWSGLMSFALLAIRNQRRAIAAMDSD